MTLFSASKQEQKQTLVRLHNWPSKKGQFLKNINVQMNITWINIS